MIEFIDNQSSLLPAVKLLGKKFAATLGFMPEGGFEDHARQRCIITASEDGVLQGYLMYRVTAQSTRVTIVHLAVDMPYRGRGISTQLLDALRDKFQDSSVNGIVLNCREDYQVPSKMWENYGFVSRARRRSRAYEEHFLRTWWYGYKRRDLFSEAYEESRKVKAMLDLNVIAKLRDAGTIALDPKEDPRCLQQDWLLEETDFCYAPELFNEIMRDGDKARAQRTQNYVAKAFTEAKVDTERMKAVEQALRGVLPGNTANMKSDRKEVASCVASDIPYFLTYDEDVLKKRDEIEDGHNVQILSPQEFMLEIDELLHKADYVPVLLQGVAFHTLTRQDASGLKEKLETFICKGKRERKTAFENVVNGCLNGGGELYTLNAQGQDVAFYGEQTVGQDRWIPFLRLKEGKLKGSLLCQIVADAVNDCVQQGWKRLVVGEQYLSDNEKSTLTRFGFQLAGGVFVKYVCAKVVSTAELKEVLEEQGVDSIQVPQDAEGLIRLEKAFFPLKVEDTDVPAYVIPIQSVWAEQLFDSQMAAETLFGAQPDKLWNFENVYYRHTKPLTEQAPARILWYISGKGSSHAGTIAACSYLDEVHTGGAKEMYRRFKHYGIYGWKDVAKLSDWNDEIPVRVLKFSHTELFKHPIRYDMVQKVLERWGRKQNHFASPVKIPSGMFFDMYRQGK